MSKHAPAIARNSVLNVMRGFAGKENFINIPLTFIDFCDGDHIIAAFFSQCLYWADRTDDPDGWIIKSNEEWYDELRLSRSQVDRCIKALVKVGLKTKKARSRFHSFAPVIHYRFDMEVLSEMAEKFFADPFAEKPQMRGLRKSNLPPSNKSVALVSSKSLYTETIAETLEENITTSAATRQSVPANQWPDDQAVDHYLEGEKQIPAHAENLQTGNAGKTTPPPPPTPSAPTMDAAPDPLEGDARDEPVKGKEKAARKVNAGYELGVALGEAWGVTPVGDDVALYIKKAKKLVDNGVPVERFKIYCDRLKEKAGTYADRLKFAAITEEGRISEFHAWYNAAAEKARKQKEAEERLYEQYPEARPPAPGQIIEYAPQDEVLAMMAKITRQENVS